MRCVVPDFWRRLTVWLALLAGLVGVSSAQAGVDEAREYLSKAQEHLAASDTLVVDNLLRLAEAALDDAPLDQRGPLQTEVEALRKQYESDASVRSARLLAQRIERLFDEAVITLGTPRGGGEATLRRIEELLNEHGTAKALGVSFAEKYRQRLALFRRAHDRKLKDRGLDIAPGRALAMDAEDDESEVVPPPVRRERSAVREPAPVKPSKTTKRVQTQDSEAEPTQPVSDGGQTGTSSGPTTQFILFGGTLSNTSIFSRVWKLLLIAAAGFVALVKSDFAPIDKVARLSTIKDYISRVPPPMWGLLMAVIGVWWMVDGWIIYGLVVSLAMLSVATFMAIDVIERVGLLGAPAARSIRKYGRVIVLLALAVALTHLFVGGAWTVV
ncbi:MAG: hypothetical protein NT069_04845 [Planctomycetota bacterium]|nr:hypothetical protein [Planctomycetota bacterium]